MVGKPAGTTVLGGAELWTHAMRYGHGACDYAPSATLDERAGVVGQEDHEIRAQHALQHCSLEQPVAHALVAPRISPALCHVERNYIAEHGCDARARRRTARDDATWEEKH